MSKAFFLLLVILLGVLQLSVFNPLRLFNLKPDLLLIAALVSVFAFEFKYALGFGILCGLFKDIFGVCALEFNTFLFILWVYLIFRLSKQVSTENIWVRVALIFLIAVLQNFITGLIYLYSGSPIPLGIFLRVMFLSSVYTTLLSPLIFKVAKLIVDR